MSKSNSQQSLSKEVDKIARYYHSLLENSKVGWSQHMKVLESSFAINLEGADSVYDRERLVSCYPRICRGVSAIITRKYERKLQEKGINKGNFFLDLLPISLLELINILDKSPIEKDETAPNVKLYYRLRTATWVRAQEFLGLGIGGSVSSKSFNHFNSVERDFSKMGTVPQDWGDEEKSLFELLDNYYYSRTGKTLSLIEMDSFRKQLQEDKHWFSDKDYRRILALTDELKHYYIVRNNKAISPKGIKSEAIIEAFCNGCRTKRDFARYLDERGVLYEWRRLGKYITRILRTYQENKKKTIQSDNTDPVNLTQAVELIVKEGITDNKEIKRRLIEQDQLFNHKNSPDDIVRKSIRTIKSQTIKKFQKNIKTWKDWEVLPAYRKENTTLEQEGVIINQRTKEKEHGYDSHSVTR